VSLRVGRLAVLVVLTLVAMGWVASPEAWARRSRSKSGATSSKRKRADKPKPPASERATERPLKPKTQALLDEAGEALTAGQLDMAQKKAEAAYKKQASGEALFVLGQIAQAQGQAVVAQDLFRRYLADPGGTVDPAKRTVAQRGVTQALPQTGDLYIAGDKDALVYIDDRLLGSLPLLLPLRVSAGTHAVSLLSGGRPSRGKVEVPQGQAREMRFDSLTGAVLVSVPPSVVFVQETGANLERESGLLAALEKGSQLVGYAAALPDHKLDVCEPLAPDCLLEAARRSAAGYALSIRVQPIPSGNDLQLSLWDAQVGELAAQDSARCMPCSDEGQLASVAERVATVLRSGRSRPRGMLTVTSIPSAAQLLLSGRLLGKTPWKGSVFAGQQQLELTATGYERQQLLTTVAPGQQASVSALLQPELAIEPRPRGVSALSLATSRPLWRVVTGAAAIGAGILMIGLGGSGLASDGQCVPPLVPPALVCRERIQSATLGGSLLGVGLGLSIGGVVLIAIPPRVER
jgi:hypothetical protein